VNNKFIHFRGQSSYSILESTIKIDDLVDLAKQHQMSAVCLSDRGNLFASLEFSIAAKKSSIQPIHGSILNILFNNGKGDDFAEILIIAKDEAGYKNLLKLVSLTFTKNDRKICNHITFEDLEKHSQGIIVLSAYTDGIIGKLLLKSEPKAAIQAAKKLQQLLGDRFYFEIMRHALPNEQQIELEYLNIAKELNIPLIATNKVLFADISMHKTHDILLCIADGVVSEADNRRTVSEQCYFKSPEEMITLFSDLPEAIENTVNLVQRCYVMSETRPPSLPNFSEGSMSENDLIRKQSQDGLNKKLAQKFIQENIAKSNQGIIRKQYQKRLDYELSVICEMGFSGYFLIVSDFIKWSKQNNIAVGPGRGSGAGSIIAWSLEITNLDPIKFGLLFERFLNPERISMPDFDIDFCQERREEVISYVRSKYGHERVGQIITFGKLQAKAVIKDVSRVLGLKYEIAEYLTELVPFNAINPVTLTQAIDDVSELRQAAKGNGLYNYDGDEELISQVLATALRLEGLQRHASTHAAGIVIANQEMTDIVPVYKDVNAEMLVVQYSMKYAEAAGLVKFDFLGLQTLTVITKAIELIEKSGTKIDIESIPYDDSKTYKMLSSGLSTGVFQFESVGMKNALRKLEPDSVDDIIALGALYRPGPMDNIPTYIACKHGKQEVDYLHPLLENTLKTTYGVIIYQEQVMEIAQILAGYSLGSADLLRRAMGKKVKAEMDAQEEIFVSGAIRNNVSAKQAKDIFATVAKFAGYGFNKSHASAYGVISYQTAYLKANFPTEFLVACLNLEMDNSDKINIFLQEAKTFGIEIISPDINHSQAKFSIDIIEGKKVIIFAMGAIKNVTSAFGEAIVSERKQNGQFKSIIDFAERIKPKLINRRLLENVIKAGCFDVINPNRASLILSIPKILSYCSSYHEEKSSNQFSLISVDTNSKNILLDSEEYSAEEMAYAEFEVIGLFINKHPFDKITKSLEKIGIKTSKYIKNELEDGSHKVKLAGIITKKDSRMSPKGRFITLAISDHKGVFEVTIFDDNTLREYASLIKVKESVVVVCDILKDKGGIRATAVEFTNIKNALGNIEHNIQLYPTKSSELAEFIDLLASKKHDSEGNSKIAIFLPIEFDFIAKISLPKQFKLDEKDIYKLETPV
jgi:DNA polymerase III subunit alpha